MHTSEAKRGFTIVELLIVIVVISILVTITAVAYNGAQKRAQNTTRISELRSWVQIFEIYKARKGIYPRQNDGTNTNICLGFGFPKGSDAQPRCRELTVRAGYSYLESGNTAFMSELSSIAQVPESDKSAAGGSGFYVVGSWAEFYPVPLPGDPARIRIGTAIQSTNGSECVSAGLINGGGSNGAYTCYAEIKY